MISSWRVTDGVSLSVSKSKLVYSSFIFVDNKLSHLPITRQQLVLLSVRNTQVILLIWPVLHLSGQKCKTNGALTQSTILSVTSPEYLPILKILSLANCVIICNEVTYPNRNA